MQGSRQIVRGKVMQVSDSRWLEGHARFKATVRWKVVQGSRQQSAGRSCKVQGSSSLEGHARFKATVRCNSSPLVVLCRSRWRGVLVRSLRRRLVDSSVGCKFFTDSGMPQPCTSKDASYFVPP